MKKLFLCLFFLFPCYLFSQSLPEKDPKDENVFIRVEVMPEYPGGEKEMFGFISKSMQYPDYALEHGIEGKVILSFIVSDEGKIKEVKVLRGVDATLDAEAVRVVKKMPDWIPGKQNDVPVDVRFTLPVYFKLTE